MPNRILREGILDSRAIDSLSEDAEMFYRRLMSVVDDYGRIEADAEILQVRCFPRPNRRAEWTVIRLTDALHMTATCLTSDGNPLVTVYVVNRKRYLQINNFNQRIRAAASKCPSPDGQTQFLWDEPEQKTEMTARARAQSESKSSSKSNARVEVERAEIAKTPEPVAEPAVEPVAQSEPTAIKPISTTTDRPTPKTLHAALLDSMKRQPDKKLMNDIRNMVEAKGGCESDFVEQTMATIPHLKKPPGGGYWLGQARQFKPTPGYVNGSNGTRSKDPPKCGACLDIGRKGNEYCFCAVGKLAKQIDEHQLKQSPESVRGFAKVSDLIEKVSLK